MDMMMARVQRRRATEPLMREQEIALAARP